MQTQIRLLFRSGRSNYSGNAAIGWLVVLGFNGSLRQYFSLYRAVSQREGERREMIDERKKVQAPTARAVGSCPTTCISQINMTPRYWKLTKHHRPTRPPPELYQNNVALTSRRSKYLILKGSYGVMRVLFG